MGFPDTPTSYTSTPAVPLGHPSTWPDPSPPPTHERATRRGLIAVAVLGVLVLMAGTGFGVWFAMRPKAVPPSAGPSTASALEVAGTVTLRQGQFSWNSLQDPSCAGMQGFDDIREGAQVTVTDATGKVLAVGPLGQGTIGGIVALADGSHRATACLLIFKVPSVPRGVGPYGVEVGHRGVLRYAEIDLKMSLTLGFS